MGCAAATCALAPAYTIRWHIGFYPTTLLEAAILVTIAAFIVESLPRRPIFSRTRLDIPILLFILGGAISVLVSSDHRAALGLYRAYFLEPAAFFYVLIAVITTPRRASLILAGFGVALTVLAIPNIEVTLRAAQDHTLNVLGTPPVVIYTVSNAVALFEVPVIAVAAAVMLYGTTWFERSIGAFIVGLGTLSVLLTFSRGAYLALFVVAIVLALTHRLRVLLLLLVVVAIVVALRLPGVTRRVAQELSLSDPRNSLFPRFQLWGVTMRMLAHHPIFGSGLAGFANAINPYRNGYIEQQIYPHNILLNFWTETGILGVVAFGWLMVQTFMATLAGWIHGSRAWRPYQLGVLLFLVAVLAHGLVDVPFFKNDLSLQFWVFLGLAAAASRWDPALTSS
ncbi:MAG: O-antigen ligase family protein [Candidatus Dormibacteraeota bacterium]|nr:O-antigen ligase family protein [Candidatus Dormibacteraeota bacterium]